VAAKGRCAGCGKAGALKVIQRHVVACDAYAKAYRDDPTILDPEPEHERWIASGDAEAQAADIDSGKWAERERRQQAYRAAEKDRWGAT